MKPSPNSIEDIKAAILRLSPKQLACFRHWFDEYDGQVWDRQLEEDVRAGRLDALAREAREQFAAGRCKPL